MTIVGYARVSTEEQNLDLQRHALTAAGCELIFEDEGVSAIAERRPGFEAALAALRSGDTLVVWKLDRAWRSLRQSLEMLEVEFVRREVKFRSITEQQLDTSTPMGCAMFQIQNVFAELERKLISERTKAGLEAARRKGKILGRRRLLSPEAVAHALIDLEHRGKTLGEIARTLNVSPRTLNRAIRARLRQATSTLALDRGGPLPTA